MRDARSATRYENPWGFGSALAAGRSTIRGVADLGERVRRAAEAWGLVVGDALVGGTMSAVFAATDSAGRDLVLKLPDAGGTADDLTGAEAAALSMWESTGASASLVDATPDALLLTPSQAGNRVAVVASRIR